MKGWILNYLVFKPRAQSAALPTISALLYAILLLRIWFLWLGRASNEPVALAEFPGSFLASVAMLYGIALLSDVEEKQAYWEVGGGNIIHRFVKPSGMQLGLYSS